LKRLFNLNLGSFEYAPAPDDFGFPLARLPTQQTKKTIRKQEATTKKHSEQSELHGHLSSESWDG
jgi:hypothetical protein